MPGLVGVKADVSKISDDALLETFDNILSRRGFDVGAEYLKAEDSDGRKSGGRHHDDDFDEDYMQELWSLLLWSQSDWVDGVIVDLMSLFKSGAVQIPMEITDQRVPLTLGDDKIIARRLAAHAEDLLRRVGVEPRVPIEQMASDIAKKAPWSIDLLSVAYRLGKNNHKTGSEASWKMASEMLESSNLTELDRHLIRHIRARSGSYLRRVAYTACDTANQRLLEADREAVVRTMLSGQKVKINPTQLASMMSDLAGKLRQKGGKKIYAGGRWERDWRRVVRTEMAFAHSYGALTSAMQRHHENKGHDGKSPLKVPHVLVFKQPQTVTRNEKGRVMTPCSHCHRIWYHDDETPKLMPLKEVIENGENEGRKARDWVATVGPTHPNDLCGPLRFFNGMMAESYPGFKAQLKKFKGKGYDGVDEALSS